MTQLHYPPAIPKLLLSPPFPSYFSQVTTNIYHLAKHISSLAYSALSSLRQKRMSFSLPNPRNLSLLISLQQTTGTVPQEQLRARTGAYASGQTCAQVASATAFSIGGSLA